MDFHTVTDGQYQKAFQLWNERDDTQQQKKKKKIQAKRNEPKQNKHLHGRYGFVYTQNFIFKSYDTFCNGHFPWKLLISFYIFIYT